MFGLIGERFSNAMNVACAEQMLFVSTHLTRDKVKSVCQQLQYHFRERCFSPVETLWTFLVQVISADGSCRKALGQFNLWRVQRGLPCVSSHTDGYCKARQRLPEALLKRLVEATGEDLSSRDEPSWRWCGFRVKVVDGTGVTMSDTPENQAEYPQQRSQKTGLGFPIARVVVVFCLTTGAVLRVATGACRGKQTGETSLLRTLLDTFLPGDLFLGDGLYASYWGLHQMIERGVEVVAAVKGNRKVDFRQGHRLGKRDQLVTYHKPRCCPSWMSPEQYDSIAPELEIRHMQVTVIFPGFRTKRVTIVTTLLNQEIYTKEAIAKLYRQRWYAEINLRSLKTSMRMEHLRCKSPSMVRKELYTYLIAYNIIRALICDAAIFHGMEANRISFKASLQHLENLISMVVGGAELTTELYAAILNMLASEEIGNRPNRIEPRRVKRRPKPYPLLMEPRPRARKRLITGR